MEQEQHTVEVRCTSCKGTQRITTQGLTRLDVEVWAELLCGRSRFYVNPIPKDDPGPVGRCGICGERSMEFEVVE